MNKPTQEQFDMIQRLQPFFQEKMGEWQVGDGCYHDFYGLGVTVNKVYGTGVHVAFESQVQHCETSYLLHIPKPIDWESPERGLWGMIDWDIWKARVNDTGQLVITQVKIDGLCFICDPFTALLKALCKQEGV